MKISLPADERKDGEEKLLQEMTGIARMKRSGGVMAKAGTGTLDL